jgi:hypothetical protein
MIAALPQHLKGLEQRVIMLQLAVHSLRATYADTAEERADFDSVYHHAAKLRAHLVGVRIECLDTTGLEKVGQA